MSRSRQRVTAAVPRLDAANRTSEVEGTFFFLHIMKTAGTTFALHLHEIFGSDHVYPHGVESQAKSDIRTNYFNANALMSLSEEQRAEIRMYAGHFPYAIYEMLGIDAVTITILRDPVDRCVSMLKHCKRGIKAYLGQSLEEIYESRFVHDAFIDNFQTKQFALTRDDTPVSCIRVLPIDENRFRHAISNLESTDFIGLTEYFGDFCDELHQRFGWQFSDIRKQNVSREPWGISPGLARRIADDNGFDLAFYEHARKLVGR
jgi:Sulfotransferase family